MKQYHRVKLFMRTSFCKWLLIVALAALAVAALLSAYPVWIDERYRIDNLVDLSLAPTHLPPAEKTVWLLWYQGWGDAPYIVRAVAYSWQMHNPGWDVVLLSRHNLHHYVNSSYYDYPHVKEAAKSDIIRLHLLAEHGGVWADSTMLCFVPLDAWLPAAFQPAGFWAYSYQVENPSEHIARSFRGIGVWLMAAKKHTVLIDRWVALCDDYWSQVHANTTQYPYFWMAQLFDRVMKEDDDAYLQWNSVPSLDCNEGYGANLLRNRSAHEAPVDAALLTALRTRPPYAMKLSTRRFPSNIDSFLTFWLARRLRAYAAIQIANEPKPPGARVHIHPHPVLGHAPSLS